MLCCSDNCPKYKDCALACINADETNKFAQAENWYSHGSCSIQYVNGKVEMKEHYDCGPTSNYAMFVPYIRKPEIDLSNCKCHQITMDELLEDNLIRCPHCGESYYAENYSVTTALAWTPVFKNGMLINENPNTTVPDRTCGACGKPFSYSSQSTAKYNKMSASLDSVISW
jgi:DNA-directed RNA polymerase subunit RPC12/RpoP